MKKNNNINILVVDDEKEIQRVLAMILEKKGYQVETVGDGLEALASLKKKRADVVLLDIKMPRLDGIETLRQLRVRHPDTIVMMLTAYGSIKTARQAMELGAYDYITKPFDIDFIYQLIEESLNETRGLKAA